MSLSQYIRPSFLTKVLAVLTICAFSASAKAQFTLLSDHTFDSRQILLIDPAHDIMITRSTSGEGRDLEIRAYPSGELMSTMAGNGLQMSKVNADGYIFISKDQNPHSDFVRFYKDGEFTTLIDRDFEGNAITGVGSATASPIDGFTNGWFAIPYSQGLIFSNGSELKFMAADLGAFNGWTAAGNRLFAIFNHGFVELDPVSFDVLSETSLPADYRTLRKLAFESFILLRKETWYSAPDYMVLNMLTGASTSVADPQGEINFVPSEWYQDIAMDGEYAVLTVNAQVPFYLHFEDGREAVVRIHLPSATGQFWLANYSHQNRRFQNPIMHSQNGLLVFGDFDNTGIEPYLLTQTGPELIADIHKGKARSVDIRPSHFPASHNYREFSGAERGGEVYFVANHPLSGREIWKSDGSSEGTKLYAEFHAGAKGIEEHYFVPSTDDGLYVLIGEALKEMQLYALELSDTGAAELDPDIFHWQRSFGLYDANYPESYYIRRFHSKPYIAADGSVACLYQGYNERYAWIAHDENQYIPERFNLPYSTASCILHILEDDGRLRKMKNLIAGSEIVHLARHPEHGRMVIAAHHRPPITYFGDTTFNRNSEGTFLFGLDSDGELLWDKWLPGKDISIRDIVYKDEGIFVLGFFSRSLNLGPQIPRLETPDQIGFVARYDETGTPIWSAPLPAENDNFGRNSGAIHILHYDEYSQKLIALEGGTGYNTSGSCAFSDWTVQMAAYEIEAGQLLWENHWEVSDHIRPAGIAALPNGDLWVSGHTRGDVHWGNLELLKTSNFMNCSWNGFHAIMDVGSGTPKKLFADEPELAKIVYDTWPGSGGVYVASLVSTPTDFMHDLSGAESNFHIQIDTRSIDGNLQESSILQTPIKRFRFYSEMVDHKVGIAAHPTAGMFISTTNMIQGMVGSDFAVSSQRHNKQSLHIMRMPIMGFDPRFEAQMSEEHKSYLVYPNPVYHDQVYFQLHHDDDNGFDRAMLYDISGRLVHGEVLSQGVNPHSIHIPRHIHNGIYVLRLEGPNGSMGEKLVIDR